MSVVIVTPDNYDTIRETMKRLHAQTVRHQLEVLIVAPSASQVVIDSSERRRFFELRVVEVGPVKSLGEGNAAGARQATAPIVAFLEDHSYPDTTWAETLIEVHRQPWAAVGPVIGNPNPESAISCVDFLLGFGTWAIPTASRVIDHLPTHNASYKTSLLLQYGDGLNEMLKSEIVLNWDLQAKGHQLYLESKARVYHRNFELLPSLLRVQFHAGRVFAAVRSSKWSALKRVVYTFGSPLIPLVRLRYVLGQLRLRGQHKRLPRHFYSTLVAALTMSALGEMAGFASGVGSASRKLCEFEFHRERHLRSRRSNRPA
jgi:hypothetical protein